LIFAKDEPELKDLYASLLATSMDSDSSEVHPSFVSIIQQLTSDEAKVLKWIYTKNSNARISKYDLSEGEGLYFAQDEFKQWCIDAGVQFVGNTDTYLDNLIRLRVFSMEMSSGKKFDPKAMYPEDVNRWQEDITIEVSSFGYQFMDACIENIDAENE
jgi:hypothetical protein